MTREKLTRRKFEMLDSELLSFRDIDKKIAKRKREVEQLLNFDKPERIGSKSNVISSPVERIVTAWDEDTALMSLNAYKFAVNVLMTYLDSKNRAIFDLRYHEEFSRGYTWEEIAELVGLSEKMVKQKAEVILRLFSNLRGYD
ncbi:TPA: DUF722 domain-containing protein [Bacillus cereus]|nr:DUF722 domain-containing protein [Bacillus cereus]